MTRDQFEKAAIINKEIVKLEMDINYFYNSIIDLRGEFEKYPYVLNIFDEFKIRMVGAATKELDKLNKELESI